MCRLVNSDFTLDYPAPIHPDTVLVGGFAVDRRPAPLSADLERFVSGSGDAGLIVVSFGTLVRMARRCQLLFVSSDIFFFFLRCRVVVDNVGDRVMPEQSVFCRPDELGWAYVIIQTCT